VNVYSFHPSSVGILSIFSISITIPFGEDTLYFNISKSYDFFISPAFPTISYISNHNSSNSLSIFSVFFILESECSSNEQVSFIFSENLYVHIFFANSIISTLS